MLEKNYQPSAVEQKLYEEWESSGAFAAGNRPNAEAYSIVIPPPNVTGSLHMGHALNNTIQDILVRYNRLLGKDVLWQPGTDHAGIATQMVVERQMMERQEPNRQAIGREAFVEKVWEWKEESGGTITRQLRRLGASCDWSRERFTMDDGLSHAVKKVFVSLYKNNLIYKDNRLVNWDPKLLTAISDLEVQQVETNGHLWHFKYPIEGEDNRFITVATTRPETMLGDTAVAVHPDDERYSDLIGKFAILPIVGRQIRIVADDYADPEQGSGAVKITPAHDFNDFEVGKRHDLEMINILDEHACLNSNVPDEYQGLDRYVAREKIVQEMDRLGLLVKIDEHFHQVPYGDRSNVVIEPWLTEQWYVDAQTLAKEAISAVETGKTVFVPKNWEKTYYEWMRNIQPWCVSRQLWWGHQIPAWYGPDGEIFVEESEEEALQKARTFYGRDDIELRQDDDVLDTWFSSALWPFSTLGWPDDLEYVERFYPTNVLVTAFDIIFFWVARMMMMGTHFMKEVPFPDVYIHALVRDEHGQKMSKSKGNVIDPLELIEKYGADSLRMTLAAMAAQGRDIKLSDNRVEGYRNFITKLWNASRFAEMNECYRIADFDPASAKQTVNKWIAGETVRAVQKVADGIESYRFNEAAGSAYRFCWNIFCDWYVELAKPLLNGSDEEAKSETRAMMAWVLDQLLTILHPFVPFVTEELWQRTGEKGPARDNMLILSQWPTLSQQLIDDQADKEMEWLIELITKIRSARSESNIPGGTELSLKLIDATKDEMAIVAAQKDLALKLARLSDIEVIDKALADKTAAEGALQVVIGDRSAIIPLTGVIDVSKEIERLNKERDKALDEVSKIDRKLSNESFVAKAPAHVVEEQKTRRSDWQAKAESFAEALTRLGVS